MTRYAKPRVEPTYLRKIVSDIFDGNRSACARDLEIGDATISTALSQNDVTPSIERHAEKTYKLWLSEQVQLEVTDKTYLVKVPAGDDKRFRALLEVAGNTLMVTQL